MQKYHLVKQGKDCALYRLSYADGTVKYMVKDNEGDVIAMKIQQYPVTVDDLIEIVDTYDLEKIHAERRAEHDKWVNEFVE